MDNQAGVQDPDGSVQITPSDSGRAHDYATRYHRSRVPGDERPGLGHFMLWTSFLCVYFGIVRGQMSDAQVGSVGLLILIAQAGIAGAGWGGLSVAITRFILRVQLPTAPGFWLLVVLGGRLLVEVLLRVSLSSVFDHPQAVASACTCCLLLLPTFDRKLSPTWKLLFLSELMLLSWPMLVVCLRIWFQAEMFDNVPVETARRLMLGVLPLVVAVGVRLRGETHRWWHWVGVGTWTAWAGLG